MSSEADVNERQRKVPRLFTALVILAVINWFVFFGVSMHLGGDSMGVVPSVDGFVLESHGHKTLVTEKVWISSLIYSSATLALTPLAFFTAAAFQGAFKKEKFRNVPPWKRWLVILFACVWTLGWYGGITKSFLRSFRDFEGLKHVMPLEK